MLADYQAAESNTDILALRSEIALVEARLTDLLKRVDTGESGDTWISLGKVWSVLRGAVVAGNKAKQNECFPVIQGLIETGRDDYIAWHEVGATLNQLRQLKESERKRLVEARQVVALDHVLVLLEMNVKAAVEAIRKHTDNETARRIITDVSASHRATIGSAAS